MNPTPPADSKTTGARAATSGPTIFRRFASVAAAAMGSPWAFTLATLTVIIWGALGHHYHYSDTWQLIINTGTSVVTFLMVFIIQNTQNRDSRAIQLKLDELIRGTTGPRNHLIDLENYSEEEIARLESEFKRFRERQQPE